MTKEIQENNKDFKHPSPLEEAGDKLDAAGKSLSEALRISFIILKIIMIVLVIIFLVSGFRTVGSDERALVLRFGKIRGIGEERLLGPGLHWVFPYPIDEIIKISVEKQVNVPINSFWYFQSPSELLGQRPSIAQKLNPIREGYCVTRGEKHSQTVGAATGSDYNIVHSRWQITYRINEPERFFRNIYVRDIKPGEVYFDVITESITPILQDLVEDAVVSATLNYTIDEVLFEQVARVTGHVKEILQKNLDDIESGIAIESVQLTDIIWPRQVNTAFVALISARQDKQKAISEAQTYADETLIEAAGQAEEKISQAQADRTKVVADARASADYLREILPEYRKRPELVLQKIYQDALEYALNSADEKIIIQPTEGTKGREIRILLNRDPTLEPKSEK